MKTSGKAKVIITVAVSTLLLIMVIQVATLKYEVEGGELRISWLAGIRIPLASITEVVVLETVPSMQRTAGLSLLQFRQGNFSLGGIGPVKLYVNDITHPLVLVKTATVIYGITPESAEQFLVSLGK